MTHGYYFERFGMIYAENTVDSTSATTTLKPFYIFEGGDFYFNNDRRKVCASTPRIAILSVGRYGKRLKMSAYDDNAMRILVMKSC